MTGADYQKYVTAFLHPISGENCPNCLRTVIARWYTGRYQAAKRRQPMILSELASGFGALATFVQLAGVSVAAWRGRGGAAGEPTSGPPGHGVRADCLAGKFLG